MLQQEAYPACWRPKFGHPGGYPPKTGGDLSKMWWNHHAKFHAEINYCTKKKGRVNFVVSMPPILWYGRINRSDSKGQNSRSNVTKIKSLPGFTRTHNRSYISCTGWTFPSGCSISLALCNFLLLFMPLSVQSFIITQLFFIIILWSMLADVSHGAFHSRSTTAVWF